MQAGGVRMKRFLAAFGKNRGRGTVFALLLLFGFCFALGLALRPGAPDVWLAGEQAEALRTGWTTAEGAACELPAVLEAGPDGAVEISRVLTEDAAQGNSILLRTSQQAVQVFLNGKLLYEYSGQQGAMVDVGFGTSKHIVRLPAGWQGAALTLRFTGGAGAVDMVYLGTKAALLTLVFRTALPGLAACFLAVAMGLALLAASLLFREGLAALRLRWLGALAVTAGIWAALETRSFQLFSGNVTLCYALVFTSFALVPVCVLGFLLTYPDFEQIRYFHVIYWLSAVNFVWIQAAQFLGWAPYLRTITGVHLLVLAAAGGIVTVWLKKGRGPNAALQPHLFAACLLFGGFGMVDMLRFYLGDHTQDDVLFTRWGFLCFAGALGWQVVQQASAERAAFVEQQALRRLAYTDALTGLENRTAFEQSMEAYRQSQRQGRPIVLVADLNGLKAINDGFGHAAGDEAIVHCAAAMKEAFGTAGRVYRIGGDEFCVLCTEEGARADAAFEKGTAAFEAGMEERGGSVPYPLKAAWGWCRPEPGETIDQAFTRADRDMYEKKARMERGPELCAAPGAEPLL